MSYTEDQIEEFYNPYELEGSRSRYAFTDGYVETDEETCIPVAVFYNEDNLSDIGPNVSKIVDLGDYGAALSQLESEGQFAEGPTGCIYLSNEHCSDTGIDGWSVSCVAEVVEPYEPGRGAWLDNLPLIIAETSVPADDSDDFDKYHRACWNAMRRALRSFEE